MLTDDLVVWFEDQCVGWLYADQAGVMGFKYDETWLAQGGFPISFSLPFTQINYEPKDGLAHRFFANLLPEGNYRQLVCQREGISIDNDFGLLAIVGAECAGALSILPETVSPRHAHDYVTLDQSALLKLIESKGLVLPNRATATFRFSLAGAQNKLPVYVEQGQLMLPQNASPSSHIIKFSVEDLKYVPVFEVFTTWLAKNMGLKVIELVNTSEYSYSITKRYDRQIDQDHIKRLHQEDFCQALGIAAQRKYQKEGGPGLKQCVDVIRRHSVDVTRDVSALLDWQIFNVLVGNADAHAKNISLLYSDEGVRLAPFYDLVCTHAYERLDKNMALHVGGHANPATLSKANWQTLAQECGVAEKRFLKRVTQIAGRIHQVTKTTLNEFNQTYGEHPALQRIEQIIDGQAKHITRGLRSFL